MTSAELAGLPGAARSLAILLSWTGPPVLDLVLRAAAAALLLATALRLWTKHRARPAGIPGALLCIGLVAYLAAPHVLAADRRTPLSFVVLAAAIANPGLIWWVARGLFRERSGAGRRQALVVAGSVVLGLVFTYELPRSMFSALPVIDFASRVVPHGVSLAFILLAIIETQRDARNDLVESRRRLRVVFITSIAVYAALVAVVETALRDERPPSSLELVHLGLIAVAALAATVLIYEHGEELLGHSPAAARHQPVEPPPEPGNPPPIEPTSQPAAEPSDALRAELEAWIARQGFLEPELTIAGLAKTLRTQEYKLRRLLNGEMGFRNFNDFLHRHRIPVACERLTQPAAETSVLELSMAVGYRSLATFNRAFKEVTGLNPTAYRARHGASKTQ